MNMELTSFLLGILTVLFWKSYITPYIGQKGKNRADAEDIAHLTVLVEDVKVNFAKLLDDHKSVNQLRLAAIDDRLKAHQEAYTLWTELVNKGDSKNVREVVSKCRVWWDKNCLYLEPEPREKFSNALFYAANTDWLSEGLERGTVEQATYMLFWKNIFDAGDAIARAVALPGLTSAEENAINAKGHLEVK